MIDHLAVEAAQEIKRRWPEAAPLVNTIAGHVRELETELLATIESEHAWRMQFIARCEELKQAETKLRAAEGLPEKWRKRIGTSSWVARKECATELEAALKGEG